MLVCGGDIITYVCMHVDGINNYCLLSYRGKISIDYIPSNPG